MSNQSSNRDQRRQTFKDLATLGNAPEPPSAAESSGRFNLGAIGELAEEVVPESGSPGSAPTAAPDATPAARGSSSRRGLVVFAAGWLVVLTTGSILALRDGARTEPAAAVATPTPEIVAPPTLAPAGHGEEVKRPEGPTTGAAGFATVSAAPSATPPRATKGSANSGRKGDAESKPTPKESASAVASERLGLGEAMENAVGPRADDPAPAAVRSREGTTPGTVESPPTGELRAALGVTLPAARACLGPDDAISRAEVVFGSSGAVKAVHVKGGAAGKTTEGCIVSALGKAKVGPFRRETYATVVTVRAPGDP